MTKVVQFKEDDAPTFEVHPREGQVFFGSTGVGFFSMDPESIRGLAGDLLQAADEADGVAPAHIYQVDCR